MHAKMTRDRKKCFIASLKRVICKLEDENKQLRETLDRSRADEISQAQANEGQMEDMYPSSTSGSILCQEIKPSAVSSQQPIVSNTSSQSLFSGNIYTVG